MKRLLLAGGLAAGLVFLPSADAQTCPPGEVPLPAGSPGAPGCGVALIDDVRREGSTTSTSTTVSARVRQPGVPVRVALTG